MESNKKLEINSISKLDPFENIGETIATISLNGKKRDCFTKCKSSAYFPIYFVRLVIKWENCS